MSERKTKILLTGYRATGKTTVGKELARRLGFTFLDTDREIEKKTGKTIRQMVSEKGWPYFRKREKALLEELVAENRLVIAAGGGAVMHHDSWRRLRASALTVWLTASADTISRRMLKDEKSESQRPSLTAGDVLKEIKDVLTQRRPFYEQGSDLQISAEQELEAIVDLIVDAWLLKGQADGTLSN